MHMQHLHRPAMAQVHLAVTETVVAVVVTVMAIVILQMGSIMTLYLQSPGRIRI